jgi:tRNA threonylcarbamoyladenosine biosynthesis protein TsaB
MNILALDSTAEVCTVALCSSNRLIAEMTVNTGNTHSQTLLPIVEQILKISEMTLDDVDLFACSTGPGSFTGVRIGAATLKGLAYGKDKPCVSVSTLDALAYNLIGFDGILCPVMNARRSQVYNALYECRDSRITKLCPDRAISIDELDRELAEKYPDEKIYLCGDGYGITEKGFDLTSIAFVPERMRYASAYSVACCALKEYNDGKALTDATLVPIYLRPSQAERERNERLGIN